MHKITKHLNIINDKIYNALEALFIAFKNNNSELYLVGGCIRDLLLGKTPKDYDLCTNLKPEEVKEILSNIKTHHPEPIFVPRYSFIDTGIKHGTITVFDRDNNLSFEITTYRIDGEYKDSRHPESVEFVKSLKEDLKRRDFTINSFAYDLLTEEVLMLDESYISDLEYGVIRTVGCADKRFNEDALRMLRAIRFAGQLGFTIEGQTYDSINYKSVSIKNISKERIRDELTKILLSDHPEVLELFVVTEMARYAFDNNDCLRQCLNCDHQNPYHYTDVFHHTIDVVRNVPKVFELRWAALFHDLGKPTVKELKPNTTDHYRYIGHEEESAKIAMELMDLLKFSNNQKDLIYKYVKYHDAKLVECKTSKFKKVVADIGLEHFRDFIQLKKADSFAHMLSTAGKYATDYIYRLIQRFKNIVDNNEALTVRDLAINGDDILANSQLKGEQIGRCLRYMTDQVLEHPEYNTKEKLLELLETFKKGLKNG